MAQPIGTPSFDLERLWLNPGGRDGLLVGGGDTLDASAFRVSLAGHYEHAPLLLREDGVSVGALVQNRLNAHVTAAWGVTRWLELGAQLPVVLWQGQSAELAALGMNAPTTTAIGAPWLQARVSAVRERDGMPFDLSVDVLVNLPIAVTGSYAGDGTTSVLPRVGLGKSIAHTVRLGLEVGGWFRTPRAESGVLASAVSPSVLLSLGASTMGPRTRFEGSVRATVPTNGLPVGAELMVGVRQPLGPIEIFGLAGPGFGQLPGTPLFRVLVGVAFPSGARPPDLCAPGQTHGPLECPDLDDDGDGLSNRDDLCALLPGVASAHGCPDGDGDGVKDSDDRCPSSAGTDALEGCRDTDGDGVRDDQDRCPASAGPAANAGCAWPDQDGDGVPDRDDACPTEAAPGGCPARDSDRDGVPDAKDKCPDETGTAQAEGCPAAPALKLEADRLIIREKIAFDTAKATIQPKSFALLGAVARLLVSHPEVKHVFIDGHTDAQGSRSQNLKLSKARAEAVKTWLAKAGVDATRLEARGFGPDRPIADNDTAAGREQNRRVEFLIETGTTTREIK